MGNHFSSSLALPPKNDSLPIYMSFLGVFGALLWRKWCFQKRYIYPHIRSLPARYIMGNKRMESFHHVWPQMILFLLACCCLNSALIHSRFSIVCTFGLLIKIAWHKSIPKISLCRPNFCCRSAHRKLQHELLTGPPLQGNGNFMWENFIRSLA